AGDLELHVPAPVCDVDEGIARGATNGPQLDALTIGVEFDLMRGADDDRGAVFKFVHGVGRDVVVRRGFEPDLFQRSGDRAGERADRVDLTVEVDLDGLVCGGDGHPTSR